MAGTTQDRPAATFFTEEATRQILARISNVFNDPDLCDATFIVGDDNEKEEISAPSQFMAIASPYFKDLFYPPSGECHSALTILLVFKLPFRLLKYKTTIDLYGLTKTL